MVNIIKNTKELFNIDPNNIDFKELINSNEPIILKGIFKDWPIVQESKNSSKSAIEYLLKFYNGKKIVAYTAEPEHKGRFFYNKDFTGLNFKTEMVLLDEFLSLIEDNINNPNPPAFYIGSTDLDLYFPNLKTENKICFNGPFFEHANPIGSIWIGNKTTATAHFDMSHNIAVCVAGKRRFTLFSPDQVNNLYPGPLEPTPGGQVVSLVDFQNPDYEKFPNFKIAEENGQYAYLEPGDALIYPAMWWHHVEAKETFNILINYWWNTVPKFMDTPMNTIYHAILSLRDRPENEKSAWKALFDYYIFSDAKNANSHIPEHARGNLAELDDVKARRLRALILNKFNR